MLEEARQAHADAGLVPRNNRRLRDRQAERLAKGRGHGEPVSEGAHHGCLCCRADEEDSEPWLRSERCRYEQRSHYREQCCCNCAIPAEREALKILRD